MPLAVYGINLVKDALNRLVHTGVILTLDSKSVN